MGFDKMLQKDDYDIYSIDLGKLSPFCSKKKIRQLLRIQLEKLHPCFSEQCTFDYAVYHEKGRSIAKVIVIDTLILTRIFGTTADSYLKAEEFRGRKLFVSEKVLRIRKIGISLTIVAFGGIIAAFTLPVLLSKKETTVEVPVIMETEVKDVYDISVFLSDTLPLLVAEDINISYFEYSSDKVTQAIIHESGVQREVIDTVIHNTQKDIPVIFSSTTYQDKIPFLTFSVTCDKQLMKSASFADVQNGIAALRNAVFAVDGLPISEQYEIKQFQFIIPYKSFDDFLSWLENIQEKEKTKFQKIVFDYNRDIGTINCIIVLDQFKCEEPVKMTQLTGIFKAPIVQTAPKPKTVTPVEKKPVDTGRTLVGKMPSADGGTILYYRTVDGKIEYEKE